MASTVDLPAAMRSHAEAALLKVAELGSFANAARALGLSTHMVVNLVHALESSCGTRLVVRRRTSIQATERGAAYVRALRDGDVVPVTLAEPIREILRLDLCASEARSVVLPAVQRFCVIYPDVMPHFVSAHDTADWPDGLDGALRLGERYVHRAGARVLGQYRKVTCASPDYLRRRGVPSRLDDLDAHVAVPLVESAEGTAAPLTFGSPDGEREIVLRPALVTDDVDMQITAVLDGHGIAQLPLNAAVRTQFARGNLVPLLPQADAGHLPIVLLQSPAPGPAYAVFADWLAALYHGECSRLAGARTQRSSRAASRPVALPLPLAD